jgi:hypothetical protein
METGSCKGKLSTGPALHLISDRPGCVYREAAEDSAAAHQKWNPIVPVTVRGVT